MYLWIENNQEGDHLINSGYFQSKISKGKKGPIIRIKFLKTVSLYKGKNIWAQPIN